LQCSATLAATTPAQRYSKKHPPKPQTCQANGRGLNPTNYPKHDTPRPGTEEDRSTHSSPFNRIKGLDHQRSMMYRTSRIRPNPIARTTHR
jgi:hypothetical protein